MLRFFQFLQEALCVSASHNSWDEEWRHTVEKLREPARGELVMRALLWRTNCAVKLLCTFLQERHKGGPQTSSQGLRLSSLGTKKWLPQWYWSPDKHAVGVGLKCTSHSNADPCASSPSGRQSPGRGIRSWDFWFTQLPALPGPEVPPFPTSCSPPSWWKAESRLELQASLVASCQRNEVACEVREVGWEGVLAQNGWGKGKEE